jgi:hypothetical protein
VVGAPAVVLVVLVLVVVPVVTAALPPSVDLIFDKQGDPSLFISGEEWGESGEKYGTVGERNTYTVLVVATPRALVDTETTTVSPF